jgi:TRAP-type mannitol/chloroaromatic compound transport system permease small subunit
MHTRLDAMIEWGLLAARWLALPVAALLFLQWPLRELVRAYSREANDLGQWLFAIFVAVSVVAATRANAHLASDVVARRFSATARALIGAVAICAALMPWALFLLWSAASQVRNSVIGLERFPDTGNPGYFIVKLALLLLFGLILAQSVSDVTGAFRLRRDRPRVQP